MVTTILIHAKWCHHCPTMNPETRRKWKSACYKLLKRKGHKVRMIEETTMKARYPELRKYVKFYPTVLVKNGQGKVKVMKGAFTTENIVKISL